MINPRKRFEIFKRDSYTCQICGNTAEEGARLEVDHKLATANGGDSESTNLWTLCFNCNRGKSSLYIAEPPLKTTENELPHLSKNIYNNFPRLLKAKNVSINQFAKDIGVTYATAFNFYHCKHSGISFSFLERLCAYFGVGPAEILNYLPDYKKEA